MGVEEIKTNPFFEGVDYDHIRYLLSKDKKKIWLWRGVKPNSSPCVFFPLQRETCCHSHRDQKHWRHIELWWIPRFWYPHANRYDADGLFGTLEFVWLTQWDWNLFSSSSSSSTSSAAPEADLKNKDWVFVNYTYKRFEGLTARGAIPSYMKSNKRWMAFHCFNNHPKNQTFPVYGCLRNFPRKRNDASGSVSVSVSFNGDRPMFSLAATYPWLAWGETSADGVKGFFSFHLLVRFIISTILGGCILVFGVWIFTGHSPGSSCRGVRECLYLAWICWWKCLFVFSSASRNASTFCRLAVNLGRKPLVLTCARDPLGRLTFIFTPPLRVPPQISWENWLDLRSLPFLKPSFPFLRTNAYSGGNSNPGFLPSLPLGPHVMKMGKKCPQSAKILNSLEAFYDTNMTKINSSHAVPYLIVMVSWDASNIELFFCFFFCNIGQIAH